MAGAEKIASAKGLQTWLTSVGQSQDLRENRVNLYGISHRSAKKMAGAECRQCQPCEILNEEGCEGIAARMRYEV